MFKLFNKKSYTVQNYSYSFGGDMVGSYRSISIKRIADNNVYICTTNKDWHDQPVRVTEVISDDIYMKKIDAIFNEYNMITFSKFPKNKVFVHDKGNATYNFELNDNGVLRFSDTQVISGKGAEAIKKIHDIINKAIEENDSLPGLKLDLPVNEAEEYTGVSQLTEGVLELSIVQYSDNCLYYFIKNGTDNEYLKKESLKLYLGDKLIFTEEKPLEKKVPKHYCDRFYLRLNERLKPGEYTLCHGDLKKNFIIK